MARRTAIRSLVLILLLTPAALPASAARPSPSGPVERTARRAASLWHALLEQLVSPGSTQKLGPSIDPKEPGPGGPAPTGDSDLGLGMDPNG